MYNEDIEMKGTYEVWFQEVDDESKWKRGKWTTLPDACFLSDCVGFLSVLGDIDLWGGVEFFNLSQFFFTQTLLIKIVLYL